MHRAASVSELPTGHIDWHFLRPQIDLVLTTHQAEPMTSGAAERFARAIWRRHVAEHRTTESGQMSLQQELAGNLFTEQFFIATIGRIEQVMRCHAPRG